MEPGAEGNGADPAGSETEAAVVAALVESHRRFLAFLERRLGGDRALAEDVLQEAFARGLERAGDVREPGSAVAWFFRLLRNALADRGRRASSARALELALDAEPEARAEAEEEVCRCVAALAGTLKPEYEAAVRRVELDGLPLAEFAAEAGITPNNAAVRVHRARRALRERVARACGTCAEHGCLDCTCGSPGNPEDPL